MSDIACYQRLSRLRVSMRSHIAQTHMPQHWRILSIVAGLLLAQFVLNSAFIYSRVSHPLHVLWTEWPGDIRGRFPEFLFFDLEQLGFCVSGYLVRSDLSRPLFLAILVHPQNKDSAELFISGEGESLLTLPIFKTRFADGFAFEVGNSRVVPHKILGGPNFPAFNFPNVHSTASLYRIHSLLKKEFSESRAPVVSEGSGEIREFARKAEEVHDYTMSGSNHRLSADGTKYRYTLIGALRAAWQHHWPIAPIKRWLALGSAIRHANRLEKSCVNPNFSPDVA